MTNPPPPSESGENPALRTYRVTREFEVSARSENEAETLLDEALAGGTFAEPAPVQQGQVTLPDGDVWGVLGWRSYDPRDAPVRPEHGARHLAVGVIVWDDQGDDDPTVLADPNPTALARAIALLLHQRIAEGPTSDTLARFLEEHPPAQDWAEPKDVDDWLDALRETTPLPSVSFHEVPISGGADGTDRIRAARMLTSALARREQELDSHGSDASPTGKAEREGLGWS